MTLGNLVFLELIACTVHLASVGTELVNNHRKKKVFVITMKLLILDWFTGLVYTIILICNIIVSLDNTFVLYTNFLESGCFVGQGVAISFIYFNKNKPLTTLKRVLGLQSHTSPLL